MIQAANSQSVELVGRTEEDLVGLRAWDLEPAVGAEVRTVFERARHGQSVDGGEHYCSTCERWIELLASPGEGGIFVFLRDVSRTKRLERELRHSQKMEVVGSLTGGMAHDFNNLLTVILSNAESLKEALANVELEDDAWERLAEIEKAGEQGAAVIRRLMAYSQDDGVELRPVDLDEFCENLRTTILRWLPSHVEVRTDLAAEGRWVMADPEALNQIVLNLATNARDAMPDGGQLTLRTYPTTHSGNEQLDYSWAEPGEYVVLEVSDTGTGLEPEVREKLYEPFVTSKEVDAGTGLGLSMVVRLVSEHGGAVRVRTAKGGGTTFEIHLATAQEGDQPANAGPEAPREDGPAASQITLLLVEDEAPVRQSTQRTLEHLGYTVDSVESGEEALQAVRDRPDRYDVIVSDFSLPGITGSQLFGQLDAPDGSLGLLLVSGDFSGALPKTASGTPVSFVSKPWTVEDLDMAIGRALKARTAP